MSSKTMGIKLMVAIVITTMLASCNIAGPTQAPTSAATSDQQATLDLIRTQVAQTIVANPTEIPLTDTPALPTNTPTITFTPTNTVTPLPTNTPLPPTALPTKTLVPWTATPVYTATSTAFNCTITEVTPNATTTVKKGVDFDGRWVVKNTGTETWLKGDIDIKYISGIKFQVAGEDALDMTSDVAHDASYTVIVDMVAPTTVGSYVATWALVRSNTTVCTLPLTVIVVN